MPAQNDGNRRSAGQNCKIFVHDTLLPLFWACHRPGSGSLFWSDEGGYSSLSDAWWRFLPKLDRPRRFCRAAFLYSAAAGWTGQGRGQEISASLQKTLTVYLVALLGLARIGVFPNQGNQPRCEIAIVMGKTDPEAPRHSQQSQILVTK